MKKKILLAFCVSLLGACQPTMANRGNVLDPDRLAEITPGRSTREEVATKLGTPTQVSAFDEKIWYYVGRQTEQYSFLDPEVIKQQAIEVRFDEKGTVVAVDSLDVSKTQDIDMVDRATPTYGHDDTFIRQLLGNLSHPVPNMKDINRGSGGGTTGQ